MPAKEILAAIRELEQAGWRIKIAGAQAHAHAKAYCPGGAEGCPPLTIYGTPRVPENEAAKIGRRWRAAGMGTRRDRGRLLV
jgi:hypothetical protein